MDIFAIIGQAAWILGLSFMASISLAAWKRIPAGVRVPMRFNGRPHWRVPKPVALLYAPTLGLAFAIGLRLAQGLDALTVLSLSLVIPLLFTAVHLWLVVQALRVLADEGLLRR